ncbi:hypothetical protein MLD38_034643 [Melastoma candidum]|uniref:Uncharacterized protein n=1 Tax=Melastoma candidum TaxID=119954 RepID=A0ACB9MAK5_9MYRT|nr:hypothetical protein MLD38_034643 [Melastoma candidum]
MTLPWWRIGGRSRPERSSADTPDSAVAVDVAVPIHFRCPISLDLMKDPVALCTGITYDRESIERWIDSGKSTCPVTKRELADTELIPNHAIRKMIQAWCVENRSHGIERIPTPRIPVMPYEVSEACRGIVAAAARGDGRRCGEVVARVRAWGKESERNRRCVRENGAGDALATAFECFSRGLVEKHAGFLGELLSLMTWVYPTCHDGWSRLGTASSRDCILRFLNSDDLTARRNAVLVLKEIVSSDYRHRESVASAEGMMDALVRIIKEQICPAATNASLLSIYNLIGSSETSSLTRSLELGLVHVALDLLVDSDKGTCERALAVLDLLCDSKEGRELAYSHALTMPILVKKILRVSNSATDLSISILWKLLIRKDDQDNGHDEDHRRKRTGLIEAIQIGGFQKMLVLLQVGCRDGIKDKVRELLKAMNLYKGEVDCIESSLDLKYIKRG